MAIEWAAIIADNVIGYILDQSGLGEALRNTLRHDPQKQAFKHALILACEQFEHSYPDAAASLFNLDFFKKEGGPVIEQFLIRNGHPNPAALALRWAHSLNLQQTSRTVRVRELERASADFLSILNHTLLAESALKELNDSRALERTADQITTLSTSFETFLAAFLHKLETNKATPGTQLDYLHWLIERDLYLDPRGILQTQRSVQVKLDDIYISLRAHHDETAHSVDRHLLDKELAEIEAKLATSHLPTEDPEDFQRHFLTRYQEQKLPLDPENGELLELVDVVYHHTKLVILGDPGSGKTTLLRYLVLKHAQTLQADYTNATSQPGLTHFPILLRIAEYAEYGLPKGKSLSDFLGDYCSLHECPADGLVDLFMIRLTEGHCLILFDGLDEIVNADERRNVVRQIEEFVRRYDHNDNHFVITSRSAGYRSAPLGEPFTHYLIQEMDESQIRQFLERWCIAVEAAQTPDLTEETRAGNAHREIEGIMAAVQQSQGVRRLAANPLLLRILALIHRTGAQLPQKRIELYRLTADTLARTWRMSHGIAESALVKDEYLTPLLSKLAYWLHVNKSTGIATEREVYEVLGEEWANLHDMEWDAEKPHAKIQEEVRQFLLIVREHTGLFVERAPKRYGFMHLTFEEYYAARYLVARSRTRARLIREHLHDPHWNEPILLALGFVGMESSLESSELLETAILARGKDAMYFGFTPSLYEDILGRDYLFALRCIGDGVPVRPPLRQRLLKRFADELLRPTGSARFWRYRQALYERLEALSGSDAIPPLLELLDDALNSTDTETRHRAEECLRRVKKHVPNNAQTVSAPEPSSRNEHIAVIGKRMESGEQPLLRAEAPRSQAFPPEKETTVHQILSVGRSGSIPGEGAASLLTIVQQSTDSLLRQASIWSLGRLKQPSADVITTLIDALRDADVTVRYTAAVSLRFLGMASPQVITALLNSLHDTDFRVRQESIRSLISLGCSQTEVIEALRTLALHDTDPDIRYEAAIGLAKQGESSPHTLPLLLEALHEAKSWSVRCDTAHLLGQIEQIDEHIIEVILQGLLDDENKVRTTCVETLAQLGRRFPEAASTIGNQLAQAIEDPLFEKPDTVKGRSAHEYAFYGLWLMVVSGEIIAEE